MSKSNPYQFIAENLQRHGAQEESVIELPELNLRRKDSLEQADERLNQAGVTDEVKNRLLSKMARDDFHTYTANIENYIGTVSMPLGLAGPLSIKGSHANGDYYIPLATTEAALVASYNRGLKVIRASGGCTSLVLNNAVQRAPCFVFDGLIQAAQFCVWIGEHFSDLKEVAERTTRFGKLRHIDHHLDSNLVVLAFHYSTNQAAGQNMVTLATEAAYEYILAYCPIKPRSSLMDANASGDKKMSFRSMLGVRGYKITAEVCIPCDVFEKHMGTNAKVFLEHARVLQEANALNFNLNPHLHFANALAAIFIACGQDAACVAEAATGMSKISSFDADHIYASVTMPNIIVGTVGGGTNLPTQKACLDLLNLKCNDNSSAEFAEIIAGVCLAGELSLGAAISNGDFARAHKVLARVRRKSDVERV